MIRALVFDFDGLIIDSETPLIDAWESVHREAGVAFAREAFIRDIGQAELGFDPWSAFSPSATARQHWQALLHRGHHERLHAQPILPGVRALLEAARERGLRLAMASSSDHAWVDGHLARLGLAEFFEIVRCRDDVARAKPWPDLYLSVLAHFGLEGREALALEDSRNGSLAAKRAGLWCVVIPNPSTAGHDVGHADGRLTSLSETTLDLLLAKFG